MTTINKRLAKARLMAGFQTAKEFAAAHGLRYTTYASHERGDRTVKTKDLKKYADLLGVDYNWLMVGGEFQRDIQYGQTPKFSGGMGDTGYTGSHYAKKASLTQEVSAFLAVYSALSPAARKVVDQILLEEMQSQSPSMTESENDPLKKRDTADEGARNGSDAAKGRTRQK